MKRQISSGIVTAVLFVSLACIVYSPMQIPTDSNGTDTTTELSGLDGKIKFQDSVHGKELTITVKDERTGQPLDRILAWFTSNGNEVLIELIDDPLDRQPRYPVTIREVSYSGQDTLTTDILLTQITTVNQSLGTWRKFLEGFPEIEKWGTEAEQLCITPEQANNLGIGFLAKGTVGAEIEKALPVIYDGIVRQSANNMLDGYAATQRPSILRFTAFLAGTKPKQAKFMRLDGFCLEPLDRWDRQSALYWLLYGIEQQELYAFRTLTAEDFYGYANYIEGGDPVSREQFLQDLETRLKSSQVMCTGYEGNEEYIRVWTKDWSPAWQMNQVCYDSCTALETPYQSTEAGFFLYNLEGKWWLNVNYINTPEMYYFSPYMLTPCNQPG